MACGVHLAEVTGKPDASDHNGVKIPILCIVGGKLFLPILEGLNHQTQKEGLL